MAWTYLSGAMAMQTGANGPNTVGSGFKHSAYETTYPTITLRELDDSQD
jgi:hypothetical protein